MRWVIVLLVISASACGKRNFNVLDAPEEEEDASTSGLVLHLTFDSDYKIDDSGFGHHPTCGSCPPAIIGGRVGIGAGHFDADECLLVPDAPDLRPPEITIMTWARAARQDAALVSRPYQGATTAINTHVLYVTAASTAGFGVGGRVVEAGQDGGWHHFAGVYASGMVMLYVDATLIGSMPAPHTYGQNDQLRIGCDLDANTETLYLTGDLDDVRIYDRPLTQPEIFALTQLI